MFKLQKIELEPIDEKHVEQLRRFDLGIYPIIFPRKYYKEIICSRLARVIVEKGIIIASVSCKIEFDRTRSVLYIITLAVSALYREQGIGSILLNYAEEMAKEHCLDYITLHVQTSNRAAISLYKKRGFTIKNTLQDYYPRLQPTSAYHMEKNLTES